MDTLPNVDSQAWKHNIARKTSEVLLLHFTAKVKPHRHKIWCPTKKTPNNFRKSRHHLYFKVILKGEFFPSVPCHPCTCHGSCNNLAGCTACAPHRPSPRTRSTGCPYHTAGTRSRPWSLRTCCVGRARRRSGRACLGSSRAGRPCRSPRRQGLNSRVEQWASIKGP